jgi:hypothetical protein
MSKTFATVNTQLKELKENDPDISESSGDEEVSHFQVHEALQFTQIENDFSPTIANLFKQSHSPKKLGTKMKLDLREIILLDSQSTMDLFCNQNLAGKSLRNAVPACV